MEAFKTMIAEMNMQELHELADMISRDIVKYVDSRSHRNSIKDWIKKQNLVSEEIKLKRQILINFEEAA